MSDIPEDIENKAERLIGEWSNGPFGFSDLQDAIARAMLAVQTAERERCKKLASEYPLTEIYEFHTNKAVAFNVSQNIADMIGGLIPSSASM